MTEQPQSAPTVQTATSVDTPCLHCVYDLADGENPNCPECEWPADRKPGLLRPVGMILCASGALTFGVLLFLWNSLMVGLTNAYSSTTSYPSWHASFYLYSAIVLWILAMTVSIIGPLKEPRLRHRRQARLSTIGAAVLISIILPAGIIGGLLSMAL